ncbi:uncharacterized protein LOC109806070 [Cajanus cajan]|uniref:uncharacterized protein LOC109806070 n=1 Tax=Cajanus cajan TaxID=3821 RepID=UPI00098DD552|nr:uncharacterized protein LOC109806070 [Cajanus cajan]
MEDVMTEAAPPSRFLEEDLNIFTTPSPPLPKPFLISQPHTPSLLIVALPAPSLALFRRLRSSTPAASLLLPELPLSRPNHTADLFALSPSALLAAVPFPVPAHRAHALARALLSARMAPRSVLLLDSLQPPNFRGSLSSDETLAFKLETSAERKSADAEKMLPGVPYYPSGSVVDGLGAAILARCQVLNVRASLCVSWPRFDASVVSLVKGLLQRGVLRGFEFDLGDEDLKFGRSEDRVLHSELYI